MYPVGGYIIFIDNKSHTFFQLTPLQKIHTLANFVFDILYHYT